MDTIKAIPDAIKATADTLSQIPSSVWGPLIILGSFALAAFAIYAVMSVSKGGRS